MYSKLTNLGQVIKATSKKYGNREFIYWEDPLTKETTKVTYKEYGEFTNKAANMLYNLGVRKGDIVSILLPNCLEMTYFALGVQKIGAIFGPVNTMLKRNELQFIINNNESKILVINSEFVDDITEIRKDLPYLEEIVLIGDSSDDMLNYSELMEKSFSSDPPQVEIDEKEDPAFIVYTGGTTGFPKGALLTHYNVIWDNKMALKVNQDEEIGDVNLTQTFIDNKYKYKALVVNPMFHVNALLSSLFLTFSMGGAILLTRKFSASNFWRIIEKYRITNSMVVPTVLAILLKIGKDVKEKYDTSSLLGIVSAAAPLPIELQKEFESTFNITIIPGGLGMTEVSSACFSFPDDKRIPGSVGMPINGVEALIVDQNNPDPNHPFEPNTVGEIIIRGPNVMKGYFKNPEGNAAVFLDGRWLRSGDLGYFNEDGYLFMGGRAKDMIIRGGENIYPIEIEEVLYTFPGISEAVVIGKPDKIYGELPKAFVTMKSGFNPTGKEIIEFCKTKLADFKVPVEIEFRDSLPKSNLGKPDKKTLQDEEKEKYGL